MPPGQTELSKANLLRLADRFKVDPLLFMEKMTVNK
jgi:hypothetical protein